jgi:hypothetical protein
VQRLGVELTGRPQLDDPPGIHHRDPVGDLDEQRQVMGDEDDGEAELRLEALHLAQDLPLHHHVDRRGRLVHHDQLRVARQRERDGRPLAHPAGHLVREGAQPVGRDAHHPQQLGSALLRLGVTQVAMRLEDVHELRAQPQHRVEGVHGGLEDDRDLLPADLGKLLPAGAQDIHGGAVGGVEHGRTAGGHSRGALQPGQGVDQGRLAAAALTGHAERLAAVQGEAHVDDGLDGQRVRLVSHIETVDVEEHAHDRTPLTGVSRPVDTDRVADLRRGLDTSSMPKLISPAAVPSAAMHAAGGTNVYHSPVNKAFGPAS